MIKIYKIPFQELKYEGSKGGRPRKLHYGCAMESAAVSTSCEPTEGDNSTGSHTEEHDAEMNTSDWQISAVTPYGNVRQGPNGEALLPPGMLDDMYLRQARNGQMAVEVRLVKDSIIRICRTSDPIYDPVQFRQFCIDAGAPNLFPMIRSLMSSPRRNERRQSVVDRLTMNIIYSLCFGLSQKCNFLQKDFSIFLRTENLNREALNTARQLGVTCTSMTERSHEAKLIAAYEHEIDEVINTAIQNQHLVIAIIDDFTTIHSHRRPDSERTSDAKCMCTVVVRVFPGIPAIPLVDGNTHLDPNIVLPGDLAGQLTSDKYFYPLSFTYASTMSNAMTSHFFNPDTVRQRLETHQYKESDNVRQMRRLDNLYLVDFQECRLKNLEDYRRATTFLFTRRIREYASHYALFVLGDWPTQYYLRQLVYHHHTPSGSSSHSDFNISMMPDHMYDITISQVNPHVFPEELNAIEEETQATDREIPILSVIPTLGALHISLNSQENVLLMYHPFMKYLYESIFPHSKLADKPMPWRRTLILELIYGGWTLIRSSVLSTFSSCRDPEYGALINLLDNYLPLVLAIYSVIFKSNKFSDYFNSVIRVWAMFYCFNRRHYDKAPLIWLSNILYWQQFRPDIFNVIRENITLLDEYGVENTHSILRAQTKPYYSVEQLVQKAKSIFASKSEQHNFRSAFTPPHYYSFTGKQLNSLKVKAATVLKCIFVNKSMNLSKGNFDIDSELWGGDAIPKKCLPLGYHAKIVPNSAKHCDLPGCILKESSESWKRFDGCWHAYHNICVEGKVTCPICKSHIRKEIFRLADIAKKAVSTPSFDTPTQQSGEEVSSEHPQVSETSDDEMTKAIADLQSEILDLSPPSLCDNISVEVGKQTVSKGNHCKVCQHAIKGHKGKGKDRTCQMCPGKLCSDKGKSMMCQCDFHNEAITSHTWQPLSNSRTVMNGGVTTFFFSKEICQGALSPYIGSTACTVISLLTGISFLNEELQLPTDSHVPEPVAALYKQTIINGNGMYETIDLPDYQFNLSIADILSQIHLPVKKPGPYKGIMVDHEGVANFDCLIANACTRPGLKCFVFILNPDHSLCLCINDTTIAVFDSHRFSSSSGALIMFAAISKTAEFLSVFHDRIKQGYGCNVKGANYVEIELDRV